MTKIQTCFVKDLKNILFDQAWAKTAPNFKVYSIRRGINPVRKRGVYRFIKNLLKIRGKTELSNGVKTVKGLRYDETIIYPKMLGQEFAKTKGHDHSKECSEWLTVIKGEAIFLLQNAKGKIVKDVYFVKAKAGDWVFSPKDFGHITINPTTRSPLKIGTLIDPKCQGTYEEIEKMQGACYHLTTKGWTLNKNYSKVPKLREKRPLKKI